MKISKTIFNSTLQACHDGQVRDVVHDNLSWSDLSI